MKFNKLQDNFESVIWLIFENMYLFDFDILFISCNIRNHSGVKQNLLLMK